MIYGWFTCSESWCPIIPLIYLYVLPIQIVIFHSYVGLPKGKPFSSPENWNVPLATWGGKIQARGQGQRRAQAPSKLRHVPRRDAAMHQGGPVTQRVSTKKKVRVRDGKVEWKRWANYVFNMF